MEVPIELCTSAHVYKKDGTKRLFLLSAVVALYSVAIPYCYFTAGEPRRIAMINAQKLADEKWAAEAYTGDLFSGNASIVSNSTAGEGPSSLVAPGAVVVEHTTGLDESEQGSGFIVTTTVDTTQEEDEFAAPATAFEEDGGEGKSTKSAMGSYISSFFGPSKEQKRAKKEFDKWRQDFQEKSGETVSLPPEYLPSAWACLLIFVTFTLHALFHLLCHWNVHFKAATLFKSPISSSSASSSAAGKLDADAFVLVVPPPNRGSASMVPVKKSTKALAGDNGLYIEFQRQRYIYTPAHKLGGLGSENARKYPRGVFTLHAYPEKFKLSQYFNTRGLTNENDIRNTEEAWGKNHLAVAIPSFLELLQLQLLSPLSMFQVFCSLLWLLDEYWSYTFFTLASVVIFEGTTVFQRTRTQKMLGGMAPKPSPIYVFRCGKWGIVTTKDLLPGDVISLSYRKRSASSTSTSTSTSTTVGTVGAGVGGIAQQQSKNTSDAPDLAFNTHSNEVIPCDCLLLRGAAVVNEASLTGESVPQMKDSLSYRSSSPSSSGSGATPTNDQSLAAAAQGAEKEGGKDKEEAGGEEAEEERLDVNGAHRVHTLFSGCSIVTITGSSSNSSNSPITNIATSNRLNGVPNPPDNGAVAFVLRTGFGSSQGTLLQMIEFSQQTVSGDAKETGMALLLLFVFALAASGYVLKEGLRKKEKTTHELLLKCIIIITSVVPRQFPMQMAMAVNMALMALSKISIFCTEQYRVPLAGKVSHCLFDKTGTLTTDQLVPVGIVNYNSESSGSSTSVTTATAAPGGGAGTDGQEEQLTPVVSASAETAMILAACHSLVVVDDSAPAGEDGDGEEDESPDAASVGAKPSALAAAATGTATAGPSPSSNLVGDPIELAAIKGIDWSWDGQTSTATPDGALKRQTLALEVVRRRLQEMSTRPVEERKSPNFKAQVDKFVTEEKSLMEKIQASRKRAYSPELHRYTAIQVVQRHHFSSKLQRMSVVARCHSRNRERDFGDAAGVSRAPPSSSIGSSSSSGGGGGSSDGADDWYCLVKGSPEAIRNLLIPNTIPEWYNERYESLARRGLRVLALAYRKLSPADAAKQAPKDRPREWVESDLHFGGFIAFECKIRSDSAIVVKSLLQSDHKVIMLTGDALLTSLHVAKAVGICDERLEPLTLSIRSPSGSAAASDGRGGEPSVGVVSVSDIFWEVEGSRTSSSATSSSTSGVGREVAFDLTGIAALSKKYNLLTTEKTFMAVAMATGTPPSAAEDGGGGREVLGRAGVKVGTGKEGLAKGKTAAAAQAESSLLWHYSGCFKVFARMSPQGKASIIRAIQQNKLGEELAGGGKSEDAFVLMCGDGGNDVGALKQADVGIALLSGHANANTGDDISSASTSVVGANAVVAVSGDVKNDAAGGEVTAEDFLNAHNQKIKQRNEEINKLRKEHMKEFQARYTREQQAVLQEEMKKRTEAGDFMAMFGLMKEQAVKAKVAINKENARFMALHGQAWDPKQDGDSDKGSVEQLLDTMDGGEAATGGLPIVRPGDASIAAPFTSRVPSVRAVVDLIRQGRCTLLSALMQQQIMMLESIIAAYTLSALSLHNARSSERQMMASSWLIMTAALSFSYASPLEHMHPLRPLRSLFHPAILVSILGQAAIHIACMSLAVQWATDAMGPELLKEVTEFFKKAKSKEIDAASLCGEDDFVCQMQAVWMAPFMPNLLNSVVFLVETSQMISVYFANYKGRPWMKGMLENHPLFLSVFACIGGVAIAAWEVIPQLNEMIQLTPFPDDAFRYKVVLLVTASIFGAFAWDRLCTFVFAPKVFKAAMDEFGKTKLADFLPVLVTLGKGVAVMGLLGTGNLLLIGAAFWWYRTYTQKQSQTQVPAHTAVGSAPQRHAQ